MKRNVRIPHIVGLVGALCSTPVLLAPNALGQGWCCGKGSPAPAFPVGPPIPVTPTAANGGTMSSFYGNFGPNPPSVGSFLPAGVPQTVPAMFPTAAYDTQWQRTPVTYYRPVTQFDPNYGTTVTSLQPCTSYQFQAQRVPLVAPGIVGANQWPAVTSPGYFPTGLAPAATTFPTLQQVPSAGMPVTANMPSFASTGSSSGPAATLPLATMSSPAGVAPAMFMNPTAPQVTNATAWMPAAGSAVAGTNTLQNCPNGICPTGPLTSSMIGTPNAFAQGSAMPQTNVPSIPGAASVVPMGPPTLLPAQPGATWNPNLATSSVTAGSGMPSSSVPFPSTSPLPSSPIPSMSGNGAAVMSNPGDLNPVLPPGANDPEATRQPSLGSSASSQYNPYSANNVGNGMTNMFPLKRVPVAEMDRSSISANRPAASPGAVDNRSPFVDYSNGSGGLGPNVPQILPPTPLKPLQAPSDFDAKPRWNSKLMPAPSVPAPQVPTPRAPAGETVAAGRAIGVASSGIWSV